jgi:signal transduction histidine kinase
MNDILAEILLLTGVFNFILLLSTSPFLEKEDRKPALLGWMISFAIYGFSSIYLGLLYFRKPELFQPISLASIAGFYFLVSGYAGSVFFFRPMINGGTWKTIGKIGGIILAANALCIYFLVQLPSEIRFIGPSIWTVILSGWFFYELNHLAISKTDYLIFILKIFTVIVFLPSLAWVAIVANLYFQIFPALPQELITLLDISIRVIRNVIAPFSFLIIFVYWTRYHSNFAIRSKNNQQEVIKLLEEKDHLILELSNINTLVSSGALAAGLAHELNQYLARIQINTEEAIDRVTSNTRDVQVIEPLNRVLEANSEASNLIMSLRKMLRNKDDGNQLTDVSTVIRNVKNLYQTRAEKSKITIIFNDNENIGQVRWSSLLTQVLANLVSNAIEALDSVNYQIKNIIISYESIAGTLLIKVYDNGPSIHPKKAESIFTLFTTTKKEGTGIGLWLSKFIAQRFGGDLYFENISQGGVAFIIRIPIES